MGRSPLSWMIVGNHVDGGPIGFTIVATRDRMHNRRAKKLLIDALDLWPRCLGHACKTADREDLDAAHARLAARMRPGRCWGSDRTALV